jgi:signal transduction histidine kinase/DNA-binding LacI/PurR family transcriptional regulator/AraC-like DNA-binding protein
MQLCFTLATPQLSVPLMPCEPHPERRQNRAIITSMSPLRATHRQTIGLLTKSLVEVRRSPSWAELATLAEERNINLRVLVGGILKSPIGFEAQANSLYELVNASNVDGVIVTGGLGHYIGPAGLQQFCEQFRPLPVVSLDVLLDNFPSIIPDFYAGMRAMMKHLIEDHGYRRIGFIRGPANSQTGEDRYRAYLDSLTFHGLPIDLNLVAPGTFFAPSGAEAVRLLLDERQVTLDALVAANDYMAIDALQALQARGLRIPEDVALTGFDNIESAHAVIPQLTTVELPSQKEVHLAAEILLRDKPPQNRIEFETEVVVRQSCGCQLLALAQAEAPLSVLEAVNDWVQTLADQRRRIQAEMIKACGPSPDQADRALVDELWAAFIHDVLGSAEAQFTPILNKLVSASAAGRINLDTWQDVLSIHRREVHPLLRDLVSLQRAENLWQRGRVFLAETALNLEAQQQFQNDQLAATLRSVGESLITTFNLNGLLDVVARELPRLRIPACYLALYHDTDRVAGNCRLVLAYDETGRLTLGPDGLLFPASEIIPVHLLPSDRRTSHVVYPLHFHEDRLGWVAFEIGPRNGVIYETLALQLSSALKGAQLVNEARQASAIAQQAQAHAEKADELKTRLLANVTHELRTPLNVILGYSRMALLEPNPYQLELPAALRKDLENINSSGEHLIRLINDLLDLSRAEIGELNLFPEPIAPRALLKQAFHAMADSAQPNPAIHWKLDLPPRLPMLQADPTRLRQIVLNLLSNACKFTTAGEIVLGAEVAPPQLHVWVKDTGHGIPIDRQEHIFEPFFTEGYDDQRPEGIGLGLAITRRLVALHGGSLSLDSQPGQGSTFHVYLPLPNLSGRLYEALPETSSDGPPTLLVISAAETSLPELEALANRSGWVPARISSLAQLKSALEPAQPIALAWDLEHARPGDWNIVQQIRSHPRLSNIPFILFRTESAEAEAAPPRLTNIFTKPFSAQTLSELIQSLQPAAAGGSILVVDDDVQARELFFRLLSDRLPGYPVVLAEDGRAALDWLERETPSLVILDLSMPQVDGFTVLEHLRANPRTRLAPVFVLTGRLLSYEDIQRLDYGQVVLHFKQVLSDEEMLANLQRVFAGAERVPQPTSRVVKQALVYMQQNYAHTLSRAEIAAAVGVSEDYLSRIFNKELGLSPWEYLNRYRVLQARLLLTASKDSITRIASLVGFDDPAYFSRVFQKIVGCSPREYRARE